MPTNRPDLTLLDDVVASKVLRAMNVASEQLSRLGIRHWLVGGLAVGAHGHPRATKDVDFLVADEAFELHEGGLVTMKPGVPIQVDGVVVDHLSAQPGETHLSKRLEGAPIAGLEACPIEILVYLKLKSPRPKDLLDLLELIRAGIDLDVCRAYVHRNAPDLVTRLKKAEDQAWEGDDE